MRAVFLKKIEYTYVTHILFEDLCSVTLKYDVIQLPKSGNNAKITSFPV